MAKKQSKKTGVVKTVLDSELKKAILYKLGEPSLGQQILNTVSSITAPVTDLDINTEFKKVSLSASNLANEYLDLVSYSSSFKDILKSYDNTINKLISSIAIYEQNPLLKQLREIESFYEDFNKSREKVENELYYQLTESDLQDANNKNKVLRKALKKALKKIDKQKQIVDLAVAVIEKKKPKTANNKAPKTLTLNTNFDNFKGQTETIYKETQTLFISSLKQWHNLFSKDIKEFETPIELTPKTTLADLRLFLSTLYDTGLIKNGRFNTLLETTKAFSYNGTIVNKDQYKNAKQQENYPNTLNSSKIKDVFTALKLD